MSGTADPSMIIATPPSRYLEAGFFTSRQAR